MNLRIAELDALSPLRWLDGDELHERVGGTIWYAPDGTPIPGDTMEQAEAFGQYRQAPGALIRTEIGLEGSHNLVVSTVYLGIDHNFSGHGPPIIWETMIFFGDWEDYQWRYATRHAAMDNHRTVVDIICTRMGARVIDEVDRPPSTLEEPPPRRRTP